MKPLTFYIIILFSFTSSLCLSQIVSIPDVNFKIALLNHTPIIDTNNDGEIQVSEAEAVTETIDVSGTSSNPGEITDLTGIEAFINIDELKCEYNQLATLNLNSNILLKDLFCDENEITELNINNNLMLRALSCSNNLLSNLDVTNNNNLEFLQCNFGILETLDVSNNPILHFLYVQENQLTNLDLTNNLELYVLLCGYNQITNLDLSNNNNLTSVDCRTNNNLTYINIKNGNNENIFISGSQSSNFENLPSLETVCIDDVNSDLALFIEAQVGHSINFTQECFLTINEHILTNLIVYPNPVNEKLNIQSQSPIIKVEVYNLLGQLLISKYNQTTIKSINTTSLNTGVYFIKATDQNNNYTIKQIIKK